MGPVNAPVEGFHDSFVLDTFSGRFPVFAVTHVGNMVAFVALSSVMPTVVADPAFPLIVVWSPVFVPVMEDVPATVKVNVFRVKVPVPVVMVFPFTEVGVIAPSVSVRFGVVVGFVTTPDMPFAFVNEKLVTLPDPPPPRSTKRR
jgi:hypothetical protein